MSATQTFPWHASAASHGPSPVVSLLVEPLLDDLFESLLLEELFELLLDESWFPSSPPHAMRPAPRKMEVKKTRALVFMRAPYGFE